MYFKGILRQMSAPIKMLINKCKLENQQKNTLNITSKKL